MDAKRRLGEARIAMHLQDVNSYQMCDPKHAENFNRKISPMHGYRGSRR